LAWLGSALRTSESGSVGRSEAQISPWTDVTHASVFNIEFTTDALEEKSCWHDLFSNPVIAYNFPIPSRDDGFIGLEIPIQMMAALGGASHAVEFNGGLILKGFSCMFVPSKRYGNATQWHFITNKDNTRMEYCQADQQCPNRAVLGSVDQKSLASTRAFLGWWGKVTTNLGTPDARYEKITWSRAKESVSPVTISAASIGFKTIIPGELSFAIGPKDSKLHISQTGPYEVILQHFSKAPIVLYDTGERRGWLVPSSAVIAHIAKTRHSRKAFSIPGKIVDIISTDPAQNTCDAAERMLLENGSTKLIDQETGSCDFYFRDMVQGIWNVLELLLACDTKWESTPGIQIRTAKAQRLRGWEFMDVVDGPSTFTRKETPLKESCGGWSNLARDINAIVLFASGLEDVIEPTKDSTGLCHDWKQVPRGKDYLAAGVPILNTLFERAGSLETKEYLTNKRHQWQLGKMLFEKCLSNAHSPCNCNRLQQIKIKPLMGSGSATCPGPLEDQGAVIFGNLESPAFSRITRKKTVGINNQENSPSSPHTNSPGSPSVASFLRRERSPPRTRAPTPLLPQTPETDKEDTKTNSWDVQEMEYDKDSLTSRGSQEEPEITYSQASVAQSQIAIRRGNTNRTPLGRGSFWS